ncbi:hypothetical protein MEX01_42920 [Methylorubrum extorquens]|nr:hypothetical protein MEX01_42920 [Methylorubrum extorquens]
MRARTVEVMTCPVTYRVVDCPDGRFAVVVVAASGAAYWRNGLLTLAEAEACVEDLRAILAHCGAALACYDNTQDIQTESWPRSLS